MTTEAVNKVRQLDEVLITLPQEHIPTTHHLHGGMYARTIKVAPDIIFTGVIIKVPTLLIVEGSIAMFVGNETKELHGYNVFTANKNRKQAFITLSEVNMTMILRTDAKTVDEAEREFTDEYEVLLSRCNGNDNTVIVTGE